MAAALVGCGKTTVLAPGTPVQVQVPAAIAGPGNPGLSTVHAFIVEVLASNTGKIYLGTLGLNKSASALTNVLVVLPVPTVNILPTFSVSLTAAANALSLSDLWVDADVATDGVLISAVVA